jgi:hypothetical protein
VARPRITLGGATVMVAPLGADPADPSAWTLIGHITDDDGLTYETETPTQEGDTHGLSPRRD